MCTDVRVCLGIISVGGRLCENSKKQFGLLRDGPPFVSLLTHKALEQEWKHIEKEVRIVSPSVYLSLCLLLLCSCHP